MNDLKENWNEWVQLGVPALLYTLQNVMLFVGAAHAQGAPLFQDAPPIVFKRVCEIATTALYAPGDIVAQRGNYASCMFNVVV